MPNGIGSRIKTGSCQTGQLPGRIKSELCDLSGLRIDLISRLLSLSRLYSGILHSLSLSLLLLLLLRIRVPPREGHWRQGALAPAQQPPRGADGEEN